MNAYGTNVIVAEHDERVTVMVEDSVERPDLVASQVMDWLRRGYTLTYLYANGERPSYAGLVPVKVKLPPGIRSSKREAAEPPKTTGDPSWQVDQAVYLNWPEIAEDERVHLSQHRTAPGRVVKCRSGQYGRVKTIGVRFNDDPELLWFRPVELTSAPEVG